jgi:hypothetical protein
MIYWYLFLYSSCGNGGGEALVINRRVLNYKVCYYVYHYHLTYRRAHWRFLKTVVNKLFEFMHETHEGVQVCTFFTFYKVYILCALLLLCELPIIN